MHISGWKRKFRKIMLTGILAAVLAAGQVSAEEASASSDAEIEITVLPSEGEESAPAAEESPAETLPETSAEGETEGASEPAESSAAEPAETSAEVSLTEGFAGAALIGQQDALEIIEPEWPRAMRVVEASYLKEFPSGEAANLDVMIYPDMEVECDGETGDWILVSYADRVGYVLRDSLQEISGDAAETETVLGGNGYLIAIDPGHQQHQNSSKEPIGPGSSETKMKVSSGTEGDYTGVPEYELTLEVSLKLRDELEDRGYEVLMIRTTNDVDISNVERAQMANEAGADAFLRIHADGADSSSAHGCMTICQTPGNPWNGDIYESCRALSDAVLKGMVEHTGAKNRGVYESNTYSGINWSTVPVTIVEMGFMSNEEEDRLMQTDEYQDKLVQGMADGVDAFLGYPERIPETVPVPETTAPESSATEESGTEESSGETLTSETIPAGTESTETAESADGTEAESSGMENGTPSAENGSDAETGTETGTETETAGTAEAPAA